MKLWQLSLLIACLAQPFCAGCVGGKLLDPSSAKILDDNRQPRPYPTRAAARNVVNSEAQNSATKSDAIGTGIDAAAALRKVTPPASTTAPATEPGVVTLANRHQHVGDQTNVLQIPPGRIGSPASALQTAEVPISPLPSGAPTIVVEEPPVVRLPAPVNAAQIAPPQVEPVPTPLAAVQSAIVASPPVIPVTHVVDEPKPQQVSIEPAQPVVAEPPPAPTAEDLLPEDPQERAAWLQTHYIQALQAAVRTARDAGQKEEANRLDQQLRLAYLIADDVDEAARGVDSLPEAEREAYKQFMFGLSQFLSEEDSRRPAHRNARVVKALREAIRELSPASRLELKNLAFCERVEQYGWFTEFRRAEFAPKQQVILYVEVDNATAEEKGQHNFETELAGSYQIFDDAGKLAHERTLPLDKETCRNYRRDYFLAYRLYLPEDIAPGHYRLELTIEDLKAKRTGNRKLGEAMIEFRVR